jgi:hypothetical protein
LQAERCRQCLDERQRRVILEPAELDPALHLGLHPLDVVTKFDTALRDVWRLNVLAHGVDLP